MTAEQKAATAATSSTAAKSTPEQGTEWIICREMCIRDRLYSMYYFYYLLD